MATFRGLAPELLEPWVTKIFYQTYAMIEEKWPMLFNTERMTTAFRDTFGMAGLGRFQVKPEGVPVGYSDPVQGDRKRTTVLTYGLGFRITEEAREDDQHGMVQRLPGDLALSARDSRERLAWGLVNDGHTGTTYKGLPEGDGTRRSLWNSGHKRLRDNGTWSNKADPGSDLSEAGIEAAMINFRKMTSEEDRFISVKPQTLLLPPELEWDAMRLLDTRDRVGSADNDINTVNRMGLTPMVVEYLTDPDGWSLWGPKGEQGHTLVFLDRRALNRRSGTDAQTGDTYFIATYRAEVDFDEARGTYGSTL